MLLLMAAILVGGAAIDLLGAFVNVAWSFFPVATVVFVITSAFGLMARLRA